ncbi:MAG: radical SAM protein [Thermoanaerobaculia bacterium]|nr:radical SAM protein [Thermoanaerobaculia bacterium]
MTDVLLATSFFLKNDSKQMEKMRPYAPLGTLYAASHLRGRGRSVALFDAMLAEGLSEYEGKLDEHRPRIVAIYEDLFNFLNKMCLQHAREAACRMAELARGRGARVVVAGSDVSDHPEPYFERGVEFALVGEPDHSLAALVDHLMEDGGGAPGTIPGLLLPEGGTEEAETLVGLQPVKPERDPDTFPFPAWDLLDVERYRRVWLDAHGYYSLNLASTRGCPFHCNWCAKPIWGQQYAMRSPANVAEEMELVKRTLRPDHLWFSDDIFGLQPRWVAEFADEVEARDASIPFMIQSRVDLMTEKAVDGLARAGCVEVWMGVESGSQKILDAMDKGTRLEQVPAARKRLRKAGIKACFFIQFGYPGETFEDIMATVRVVRETLPDDIGISVSYPLPGTKFYEMVRRQLGDKDHWDDSNDLAMMFRGTYETPFYRHLHNLLHRDLELRQDLARAPAEPELLRRLDELNGLWFDLGRMEPEHLSENPTLIRKDYAEPTSPDLSKRYN